jgi:hypothetical protein
MHPMPVLLLAMEEYPEVARRRDRFLIQAAWSEEDAEVDVPERVRSRCPSSPHPRRPAPLLNALSVGDVAVASAPAVHG